MTGKKIHFFIAIAALLLSTNCTTMGVEAKDHILTTSSTAADIERISVIDMPTDEGLFIRGGSDRFAGEMRVTGWFAPDQEHDIFDYISMYFEHTDNTIRPATLYHSQEVEHLTVRTVHLDIPAQIDVDVDSSGGRVQVTDIAGDVDVFANGVASVAGVSGEVSIRAGFAYIRDTGPVDLEIIGTIEGEIARGGRAESTFGDIDVEVTGADFSRLVLTVWKTDMDVRLPRGQGFTLDISAGLTVGEDEYAEPGRVEVDVGDVFLDVDGFVEGTYDVNGGGPVIVLRDAHQLTIRD